ncbi:MAG: T9SS type A sorting domain-containing protein, partial [Ignavibacteriales bacterium]|nr:T9SS type A sorting domain-containing protein [Ignavibacteriales bacterium]
AQPVVTVQDAGGNTVSSSSHAVSLAIGTNPVGGVLSALTNPLNASNGVASFSNVKINKAGDGYTLVATATLQGFATITSNSFNIIVGPPSKLSFTVQPGNGNGGNLLSIQPIVTVQDAGGNAVDTATNEITLTIGTNPCGGTLVAVENPLSASNGFAVFSGLKIDKACVGYRLTASSGTFTPAVSNLFNVNVGPAAKLSFTTQPGDGAGGSNLSTQPAVSVQDLGGNTVTSSSHSITLAIGNNPSGGTLSVESNPLNASSGVASYSGVQINKAGIGYTLTASTTGGVTGATSDSFDITFGTAAKLVFTTQPSNGIIGNNLATQPVVNIEDAVGNIVTNASNAITLALGANPSGAILTVGSNPINAVSGVATFSGVKLDKIGIGYTLRASAGGFPDSFSTTFNITDFDGVISGQKFNDYNYDGDKDGDEPGLQNWRIKLSGARTESTLTDINGNYSFIGLPPGNYQVNEVNQSGWQQTMPTSPSTYSLTITNAGGTLGGNDFGNYRFASISGLSFNDFNGNGFRELGEGGLSGWKIFLYKTDTLTLVDSITTTEEGYTFAGLVPGTYFVRKQSQDDWIPTSEVPPAIEIYSGFNISGVNFGNYQYGYISGTLFVDIDNNSTKDVGDVALEGWKVSLSGPKTDSAFSDASGNYMFDTLEAGSYTVLAEVQDGWRQNVPSASGSYFLSVVSGGALSGKNFGMFQLGTVSGLVFDDINGNAVKENGEPGVANWKLLIFGAKNDTLVTDSSGVYSVDHLQPGGYIISNVLPSNWVQTIPANNEVYVHNISTSGTNTGGNTFAIFQKGSISGYIYNDKNADAFFDVDSGEARQSGWTVNISGPISSTTVTNDSGYYSFTGLPNGLFTVTEVNQSGWSQTFPPTQGGAYSIAMSSGGSFTNKNFGNYGGRIKLRTFKSTTDLSAKPQKMKYSKKTGAIVGTPNLATAVQAVFQKLGKLGATFLGVPQTSKDSAKKYGWIYYKKAVELGKLFTGAHSGQSYPIDYVRIPGKPDKLLSKAIKANRKKFDNPLWEQAVLFKLNLLASNYGITPTGLGNLQVLSTPIVLAGRSLNDMTLGEISTYLDTVMTYWKSKEITTSAAYNNLESFRTQILKPLNEGFAQDFNSATYEIDTNGIRNLKNPYAIKMTGYKTASEVGIVREIPLTRISEPLPPQPQQFPDDYALLQNYPNPFNPITTIRFELPEESEVSLTIYDMLGREVASILINEELEEGSHDIEFDAANIASGVYFYRITATSLEKRNTFTQVKKMVLTK